jgi:hypothetical protein
MMITMVMVMVMVIVIVMVTVRVYLVVIGLGVCELAQGGESERHCTTIPCALQCCHNVVTVLPQCCYSVVAILNATPPPFRSRDDGDGDGGGDDIGDGEMVVG